jgi:hypothetical protein
MGTGEGSVQDVIVHLAQSLFLTVAILTLVLR